MQKPWYKSMTVVGGVLMGTGIALTPILGPHQQAVAGAAIALARTALPDSARAVAQQVTSSPTWPALIQGVGLAVGSLGLRKAVSANGKGK